VLNVFKGAHRILQTTQGVLKTKTEYSTGCAECAERTQEYSTEYGESDL